MNGINKITDRIRSDALAEIRALQTQTEEQCKAIADDGEQKARALYWDLMQEGTENAKLRLERLLSAADMECRKDVLRTKQELIARSFQHAADKLRSLPREKLVPFLAKLAADAAVTGEEELVFSAADRAELGQEVCREANRLLSDSGKKAALRLSPEVRETGGGLILTRGRVESNCTFSVLVESVREELSLQVAHILFD